MYNPFQRSVPKNNFTKTHIALSFGEWVESWGPGLSNMWKLWFDRWDGWTSVLDNVHQQARGARKRESARE